MGADWLYTLVYLPGGEMAARLLNFAMLAILGGLLVQLSESVLAVALFLSVPVVQLETGSLFVENTWAAFLAGAFAALIRFRETRQIRFAYLCAILAGAAMAVKFGGLAFAIPLLILLILGIKNKLLIFVNWMWKYFTFDQSLRLIIKPYKK